MSAKTMEPMSHEKLGVYLFTAISVVGLLLLIKSKAGNADKIDLMALPAEFHSTTQTFLAITVIAFLDALYDAKESTKDVSKKESENLRLGMTVNYVITALFYFYAPSLFVSPASSITFISKASSMMATNLNLFMMSAVCPSTIPLPMALSVALMHTVSAVDSFSFDAVWIQRAVVYGDWAVTTVYCSLWVYNLIFHSTSVSGMKRNLILVYFISLLLLLAPSHLTRDSSSGAEDDPQVTLWRLYASCASTVLILVAARVEHMGDAESKEQLLEVKKGQAAFMSHELRTPLNAVLLGLQMALEQTPPQPSNSAELARRQMLVETESACDAAVDILNEFLLFDKLENGALTLFKEAVPILDLVRSSAQMFSLQMRAKNISFAVENNGASVEEWQSEGALDATSPFTHAVFSGSLVCPPELDDVLSAESLFGKDLIQVDKSKVIRVLRNILSNAIKFTPQDGHITLNMRFERQEPEPVNLKPSASTASVFSLQRWALSTKSADVPRCSSAKGLELGAAGRPTPPTTPARARKSFTTARDSRRTTGSSHNQAESGGKKWMSATLPIFPQLPNFTGNNNKFAATAPAEFCVTDSDAVKYSPIGSQATTANGWLVLELVDDGAGISAENQKRLFKEVVQFHPEKLQGGGGSGLGTMISKGIVELHGGSISVYSDGEGFGTMLTVRLPMTRVYDDVIGSSHNARPPASVMKDAVVDGRSPVARRSHKRPSVKFPSLTETTHKKELLNGQAARVDPTTPPRMVKTSSRKDLEAYTLSPYSERSATRIATPSRQMRRSISGATVDTFRSTTTAEYLSALSSDSDASGNTCTHNREPVDPIHTQNSGRDPELVESTPESLSDCCDSDKRSTADQDAGESSPATTVATRVITPVSTPEKAPSHLRVLVVDDSALNRKMMIRLLDRRGHQSIEAADGLSALRMVQDSIATASATTAFDLVLIDNMMPLMNGIDATRAMRVAGFVGPVFGISGSVMDAEVRAFELAGADLVLPKPIDMKAFHGALATVLSNRQLM